MTRSQRRSSPLESCTIAMSCMSAFPPFQPRTHLQRRKQEQAWPGSSRKSSRRRKLNCQQRCPLASATCDMLGIGTTRYLGTKPTAPAKCELVVVTRRQSGCETMWWGIVFKKFCSSSMYIYLFTKSFMRTGAGGRQLRYGHSGLQRGECMSGR